MPPRKRKRSLDRELACFPDEACLRSKKSDAGTVVTSSSVSDAWLRCGDGFADSSTQKTLRSCKKMLPMLQVGYDKGTPPDEIVWGSSDSDLSSEENDVLTLGLETPERHPPNIAPSRNKPSHLVEKSSEGTPPDEIVWVSSDSDLSCGGNDVLTLGLETSQQHPPNIALSLNKSSHLIEEKSSEEEQRSIDWDKDGEVESEDQNNEWSQSRTLESAVQISDSDSCLSSSSHNLQEQEACRSQTVPADISEYSSDNGKGEDEDRTEGHSPRLGCVQKQMLIYGTDRRQSVGKSASDWLKSAQVLLQTPEKQPEKSSKTPEDSAKKRKRFLRGGLAERLNRLQNRERSAISFWRHQGVADLRTPSGSRPGVLIVKVLGVHEECSMQVAVCEQLGSPPGETDGSAGDPPSDRRLKVLFTRETAAQLRAAPGDVIHIHPPWQKLILHNDTSPVVMSTHFSQKVLPGEGEMKSGIPLPGKPLVRKEIVSLSRIFRLNDAEVTSQIACSYVPTPKPVVTPGSPLPSSQSVSDSLLEVVETQGAGGWRHVHVRVVVQRVYCLPARERSGGPLQGSSPASPPPVLNAAPSDRRLCFLVQDGYGIFSELQLHSPAPAAEDLEVREGEWEGKSCCLTGMKILQRTTRGRAPGLFNLIDSLWPPLAPIKIHGLSQDKMAMKASLPPPSFCYILAAHPDQARVDSPEDSEICDLYSPPVLRSLREVLQVVGCSQRCSFCATVVYGRRQAKSSLPPDQCELLLFVTDRSLQHTDASDTGDLPKLLPVGLSPSCCVGASVTQAVSGASPCVVFFKDAVREDGRIICVERTVLSLQKPPLCPSVAVDVSELTGPVRLDELDSTTQPHTLCSVRGVVVGVNEATALSWPVCNRCDNAKLEQSYKDRSSFYCRRCSQAVVSPVLKMQLEVRLQCPSVTRGPVKVKLQQKTICSLLGSPANEDGSYELTRVLGLEVGPLSCYLISAAGHPPSGTALEEVDLLEAAGK
ncbi:DNA repair-scaffolding protein [Pleurodeles waltl]|uniref:DNA repair-scaffolding protein n=1 Tax=Pleurodeles waltl TaxID=8319 RepID=UPI00370984B2